MIQSLQNPIGSMGIAFSSSLFGLAGTIIVGFMEQQSSRAHGRFIDDLENWLYQHASVTTVPQGFGLTAGSGDGSIAAGPGMDGDQLSALTAALTAATQARTAAGASPENPGPTLESMERLDSSIAANSHRLEQVEAGLSRNHDALITALQALVAVQDNQQSLRQEEHGKLASLDMLNDTNARLNAIMESWNTRSEQYFQQATQSQQEMVKLTADIEQLLKSRDAILGLNEQLAALNREVGESARRTESAFAGLQDFLAGSETGDQLGKLLTSMDGARDELKAMRAEAAKAAEAAAASATEIKAAAERAAASAEKATTGKAAATGKTTTGKAATTGKKSGQ